MRIDVVNAEKTLEIICYVLEHDAVRDEGTKLLMLHRIFPTQKAYDCAYNVAKAYHLDEMFDRIFRSLKRPYNSADTIINILSNLYSLPEDCVCSLRYAYHFFTNQMSILELVKNMDDSMEAFLLLLDVAKKYGLLDKVLSSDVLIPMIGNLSNPDLSILTTREIFHQLPRLVIIAHFSHFLKSLNLDDVIQLRVLEECALFAECIVGTPISDTSIEELLKIAQNTPDNFKYITLPKTTYLDHSLPPAIQKVIENIHTNLCDAALAVLADRLSTLYHLDNGGSLLRFVIDEGLATARHIYIGTGEWIPGQKPGTEGVTASNSTIILRDGNMLLSNNHEYVARFCGTMIHEGTHAMLHQLFDNDEKPFSKSLARSEEYKFYESLTLMLTTTGTKAFLQSYGYSEEKFCIEWPALVVGSWAWNLLQGCSCCGTPTGHGLSKYLRNHYKAAVPDHAEDALIEFCADYLDSDQLQIAGCYMDNAAVE